MIRKKSRLGLALGCSLICCWFLSCNRTPNAAELQAPVKSPASACSAPNLRAEIEEIARSTGGPVGVAVRLIEGGDAILINGQQRFPMQSVYKLPIGMAVLHQIDQGKLSLDQKITVKPHEFVRLGMRSPIRDKYPRGVTLPLADLLHYAVSESDGTASDVLLRVVGGAEGVTNYLRNLGIDGMMVVDTEKEIGRSVDVQYRNWATPESALGLLQVIAEERTLSTASQKHLWELMTKTPTGPKRIKGLLPPNTVVAHRTGTGLSQGLTRAVNDMGLVTLPDGKQLAIVVFVSDTKLAPEACEAVIAKISRAAWTCWTSKPSGADKKESER